MENRKIKKKSYNSPKERAHRHVTENYGKNVNADYWARVTLMSKEQFMHLYNKALKFGLTTREAVNDVALSYGLDINLILDRMTDLGIDALEAVR